MANAHREIFRTKTNIDESFAARVPGDEQRIPTRIRHPSVTFSPPQPPPPPPPPLSPPLSLSSAEGRGSPCAVAAATAITFRSFTSNTSSPSPAARTSSKDGQGVRGASSRFATMQTSQAVSSHEWSRRPIDQNVNGEPQKRQDKHKTVRSQQQRQNGSRHPAGIQPQASHLSHHHHRQQTHCAGIGRAPAGSAPQPQHPQRRAACRGPAATPSRSAPCLRT